MNATTLQECCPPTREDMQRAFLAILPRLKKHGRVYFRDVTDAERREEALSEMLALAWSWFVRLAERGKDASKFASVLATYAARSVRVGRRLCGQEKAQDVLSFVAQQRGGFSVGVLPEPSSIEDNALAAALHDNTITPIVDQVQFRLDFPRWRRSRCDRDRRLIDDLMVGERPYQMARKYGLSRSRVSDLRRQMFEDWTSFCEGASSCAPAIGVA